jgi:probable HAF family extracellular repeat protein
VRPFAINTAGQVTGYSYTAAGAGHAFLYTNGAMTDLGTLGGSESSAYAINSAGQVTGESYPLGDQTSHAFLYGNGVMTDLGTLGGSYASGLKINGAGKVMGNSSLPGDIDWHAFLYSDGVMKDLGTLGGSGSSAFDINSSGQVVGSSQTTNNSESHGFVYSGGAMIDLNSVIPAGWSIVDATAINDAGQILGFCAFAGMGRVCLLTPIATTTAHVQPPIAADGSSVFNAKRGVIPVRFTLTVNGVATCQLPPATIAVTRTAGGVIGAIDESVYDAAADDGSNFRIGDCQYQYNLAASNLGAGHYRVDILIDGQVIGHAEFSLR